MMKHLRGARRRFWLNTPWQSRAHRRWFRFCAVCLALYTAYVTFLAQSPVLLSAAETALSLGWYIVYAAGIYALLLLACARFGGRAPKRGKRRARMDPRLFAASAAVTLAILGIAFIASFPGGTNYDISNQWQQAHTGEYNNWHPVFHTLLIWLATRAVDAYWFVVALQLAAFALAMAYLCGSLCRNGVPRLLVFTVQALAVASPPVRNTLMYAGKDSAMCIGVLILCGQSVNLLFSRGKWLEKGWNAVALGLALAFTTLVRHNAILYTLPALFCALLCYRGNRRGKALAAGVWGLCVLLVQGPLYGALDVVYPQNTLEESVGLPMTILLNAKAAGPESLDAETNAFLEGLAEGDDWTSVYRRSDYNSVKFTFEREKIARTPLDKLARMTLATARRMPRLTFETVNEVTGLVWDVTGQYEGAASLKTAGGWRGALFALLDIPVSAAPLAYLLDHIGVQFLLLLLAALWALYRVGVRALSLAVPTLVYNLGTMLLLCGRDARFFMFGMAASLPSILALLYAPGPEEE